MRTKHRINYRFIALLLAVATLLTSFNMLAYALPVVALGEETPITIRDDALHFVIRHWHMDEDDDAAFQGENGQWDAEAKEYFVIAEGYIMPNDNGDGYVCCAVSQDGTDRFYWFENVEEKSPYFDEFDPANGKLYLNVKTITGSSGESAEDYTGLSISSGHSAIEYDGNRIVITYDPYVHLVKAHVFYNPAGKKVRGISKDEWEHFKGTDLYKGKMGDDSKNEIDTVHVYTYINDDGNNSAGALVLTDQGLVYEAENLDIDVHGNVFDKEGNLVLSDGTVCIKDNFTIDDDGTPRDLDGGTLSGLNGNNIQLTKFYSSAEGLHTDNTVIAVSEDGRTFTVDLEAWYNEGYAPQIGFALDASGSMAFALDDPSPITVDKTFIQNNNIDRVISNPGNNWDSYFLTDEQLKEILNPHNTDNSALSASGYSYFVQNGSSYEPLGYWEGALSPIAQMPFDKDGWTSAYRDWLLNTVTMEDAKKVQKATSSNWQNGTFDFSANLPVDWQDAVNPDTSNFHFSGTDGLEVTNTGMRDNYQYGVKLDGVPTNGNFTVSFTLRVKGSDTNDNTKRLAQLLYIGPAASDGTNNYYALYRANAGSSNRLKGSQYSDDAQNTVSNVNNIFNNNGNYTVTLVFENATSQGGTVSTYINGVVSDTGGTVSNDKVPLKTPLSPELCIVLNGVDDNYQGKELWIDDFTVYDLALSSNQVKALNNSSGTPKVAKTWNGDILGSINIISGNTVTQTATLHHTQAGWYHVSHAGEYFNHYLDIGTAKRLLGVAGSIGQTAGDENGYTYTPTKDEPTRFYVDENYNLCCFYGVNTNSDGGLSFSYVYELADGEYIRTEGLQRILGSFTNKLNQRSPSTKVSAVRYSSSTSGLPLEELVLLDWTSDPTQMANMLSLDRGDGTNSLATGYTLGANGIKQYNYGLTGSTNTASGLQSYWDNLHSYVEDENPYKYFIIFTDGANTGSVDDAVKYAKLLKGEGYTIYAVALIADSNSSDYKTAMDFLPKVIGNESSNTSDDYLFFADNLTSLTDKFQLILDDIAIDLGSYTVSNYIDPRFDLVDKDDNVWKLTAKGVVNVVDSVTGDTTGTYDLTENPVEFPLSGDTTPSANTPVLKFDSTNDMYYLEWTDQSIPTSPENADTMEVWNAVYKIRAKDDFIGGNAVLTNGNLEKMNWVRSPDDTWNAKKNDYYTQVYGEEFDALFPEGPMSERDEYIAEKVAAEQAQNPSSGTNDSKKTLDGDDVIDAYPSKGFPRTVVNVTLLPIYSNPLEDVIYLGEAVSPEQILTEIKDNFMTETYYLEYLKRFAYARYDVGKYRPDLKEQMDRPLLDLLTEWLELDNNEVEVKAFSVPYMYLPAVEWDEESGKIALNPDGSAKTIYNNTGRVETNQRCIVGVLTYRWEQRDPKPMSLYEPVKDYVKTDTDRIIYALTVEFTPLRVGDSYELFYGSNDDNTNGEESEVAEILTTAEGYPIISMSEINGVNVDTSSYAETGIFEKYLRIDDNHKATVQSDTRLDREKYINGNLDENGNIIGEGEAGADHRGSYALISDTAYKWNKDYKPAVGAQELVDVTDLDEYPYGSAGLINNFGDDENPDFRTLKAGTTYAADVVSGGIELEMKVLIGELKEAVDANGDFKYEFTVPVTRSFQDTVFVEELKKTKYTDQNGNSTWEDYGSKFNITFSFDYTATDIAALTKDEDGYVTIYAKTMSIDALNATFKKTSNEETQTQRIDYDLSKSRGLTELPIGTYEIKLNDINDNLPKAIKENLHFATEELGDNLSLEYFQQNVLNGLHTTKNGTGWNGSEKRGDDGKIIEGETYGNGEAEITEGNLDDFRAAGTTASDKALVTFYIGTATPDPDNPSSYKPVRGEVTTDNSYIFDKDNYINKRLGMLRLSTGMTMLTIKEEGGLSNESFLYHITGTTLGGVEVYLTVSVQGGESTTIVIPPGDYTVTEISDWSWRYDNKEPYGLYDDDETLNENWTIVDELTAKVSLRYKDDAEYKDDKGNIVHQTAEEHKTVVYEHECNDKVWLGGENHLDNHFAGVQ